MKLSEIDRPAPNILIYGQVGCGKTALALTLGERAQVIDMDGGLRTGIKLKDVFTEARMSVDVKQFLEKEPHRIATSFGKCKTCVISIANQCNKNTYPFDALILDSLTVLAESALNYVLSNSSNLGKSPTQNQWMLAFNEIKQVLGIIKALPIPTIVIGHEQIKTVGDEDRMQLAVSGKNLPTQITREFDEVWYMRAKPAGQGKCNYVIQTLADGVIEARSRDCLPNHTNVKIGMWKLLELMDYKVEEVAIAKT